jgi:Co/Zn/Cd efflux system component
MGPNLNPGKSTNDPSRIAFFSTLLNILVAGRKGILAWLLGCFALLADTIHGFPDTFASLLVLVGIWLSNRSERQSSTGLPVGLYMSFYGLGLRKRSQMLREGGD